MMADDDFSVDFDNASQDEAESESDNELEAVYYDAKAKKVTEPGAAFEGFSSVVLMEGDEKGQWGFKALKQIMKIQFCQGNLQDFVGFTGFYEQLVAYGKSAVKRSYFEKSVHHILDYIWTSSNLDAHLVDEFSRSALDTLKQFAHEVTWYNMVIKLGKRYLERGKHVECQKSIEELKKHCLNTVDDDDLRKGAELERCALEIQLQTVLNNRSLLPALYEQALLVQPAIPHAAAMGVIRECGGMMHLGQRDYDKSYADFFEALSHYNDTGNKERCIVCLKYLCLVSMLMSRSINPFDCHEARAYENGEEVSTLAELVRAYQAHNLGEFNKILETRGQFLMEDDLIRPYIMVLKQHFGTEELLPRERFLLEYIDTELQSLDVELERLLRKVYTLDGDLSGLRDETRILRIQHAFESYGVIHNAEQNTFGIRVHFSPVQSFGYSQDVAERKYQLRFPFADCSDCATIPCATDEALAGIWSAEFLHSLGSVCELPFSSDTFKEQLRWYLRYVVDRISALHWSPPVRVTFSWGNNWSPSAPVSQAAQFPFVSNWSSPAPVARTAQFSFASNWSSSAPIAQSARFSFTSNLSFPDPVAQAAELPGPSNASSPARVSQAGELPWPSWLSNLSSSARGAHSQTANLSQPSTDRSVHDVNFSWPNADTEKK